MYRDMVCVFIFFFKQKTAYKMRISDWSSDGCSSDLYAPEKIPYAITRYVNETNRLYGVLDKQLADREFIAGDYSIADMASYPWIVPHEKQGQKLEDFTNLTRWFDTIAARTAVPPAKDRKSVV